MKLRVMARRSACRRSSDPGGPRPEHLVTYLGGRLAWAERHHGHASGLAKDSHNWILAIRCGEVRIGRRAMGFYRYNPALLETKEAS